MPTIRMIDETTAGDRFETSPLEIESDVLTVRDLIALRVRAEVRRYNAERNNKYYGLVQPSDVEVMINGPAERKFRPIDADRQVDAAISAFKNQRFVVLMPDGQAEDLDAPAHLREGDSVSFMRLVPLVGG